MNKTQERLTVTRVYKTIQKAVRLMSELHSSGVVVSFNIAPGSSGAIELQDFKAVKQVNYGP